MNGLALGIYNKLLSSQHEKQFDSCSIIINDRV
jgi:hypothetical protein